MLADATSHLENDASVIVEDEGLVNAPSSNVATNVISQNLQTKPMKCNVPSVVPSATPQKAAEIIDPIRDFLKRGEAEFNKLSVSSTETVRAPQNVSEQKALKRTNEIEPSNNYASSKGKSHQKNTSTSSSNR